MLFHANDMENQQAALKNRSGRCFCRQEYKKWQLASVNNAFYTFFK